MQCLTLYAIVLIVGVALALSPTPASGQQIAKLSSNPPERQLLGSSVAISANPSPIAVAGAPGEFGWFLQGKVYVFEPTGGDWTAATVTTLTASNGGSADEFGRAVATNGDDIFVGAFDSLYIYVNGIAERQISRPGLGTSVSCVGDTVLVGAGSAAYLFTDTSSDWSTYFEFIYQKLTAASFGHAVATDGTTHAVSAPSINAVYLYQALTETPITTTDSASGDNFGWTVSVDGRSLAVGAPNQNLVDGAAYIFQDTSAGGDWSSVQETKIMPSDHAAGDRYGVSVAIKGRVLAIGGTRADDGGTESVGAVWLFEDISTAGNWSSYIERKLLANDRDAGDRLGIAVDLSASEVLCGAYHESTPNLWSGSAYLFRSPLLIFADGFESGNTSAWSSTVGG